MAAYLRMASPKRTTFLINLARHCASGHQHLEAVVIHSRRDDPYSYVCQRFLAVTVAGLTVLGAALMAAALT
jgi:hypothetical protein